MSHRIYGLLLLCLFSTCLTVQAVPYVAGPYTVDIDVRNTTMALIPGAKVSCWLDGKTIRIGAKAPGYLSQKATIQAGSGTYYKYDFTLSDMEKAIYAVDVNGVQIKTAYFEAGQYGVPGNEYCITAYIPTKDWPRPAHKRVDIFDTFWGGPWKIKCNIEKVDEFYRVKLNMSRKAVEWTSRQLLVVFDLSKKVAQHKGQIWLNALRKLENNPKAPVGMAGGMAEFLFNAIPPAEAAKLGPLPQSLEAYYSQAAAFDRLHRDAPEN